MFAKTKDQKRRIIPLDDQAIEVLRTLPRHVESPSVFALYPPVHAATATSGDHPGDGSDPSLR